MTRIGIRADLALVCVALAAATAATAPAQTWHRHDVPKFGDGLERAVAALQLELARDLRFGAAGFPALPGPAARVVRSLGFTADGAALCLAIGTVHAAVTVADGTFAVRRPSFDRRTFGAFAGEPRLELGPPLARTAEKEAAPFPFEDVASRGAWLSPSGAFGVTVLGDRRVAIVDVAAAEPLGTFTGWTMPIAWDRTEARIAMLGQIDAGGSLNRPASPLHVVETTGRRVLSITPWRPAPLRRVGAFAADGGALFWADDRLHRTRIPDGRTLENADADVKWLFAPAAARALLLSHDGSTLTAWVGPRLQPVKSARLTDPAVPGDAVVAGAVAPAHGLVAFATTQRVLVYRLVF